MRRHDIYWALLTIVAGMMSDSATAQVRAIYDQGASAISRQLLRLQTTASVLHTGAHPDDEDSALVAYHARRLHARTAYLSLTRGSGGQNIIGTEQSDLLGVIRTEELLQARRLDGASQLFTRANDFGFSKYRSEAARLWGEEAVLSDMVRAIRQFRPNVIVSRWNGSVEDGHGHHQFAGHLTPLAFKAAADRDRFPEQIAAGLSPWQANKLYVIERIGSDAVSKTPLVVNTGERDAIVGRSYFEIGMQGRSQQKTQQMGSLELRGTQLSGLRLIEPRGAAASTENSVFDGIDTTIGGIAALEPSQTPNFTRILAELEKSVADALTTYDPFNPQGLIPVLADGLGIARSARDIALAADTQRLLDEKIEELEAALVLAAGVSVDALAETETIIPGGTLQVAVRVFIPELSETQFDSVSLTIPPGWSAYDSAANELSNESSDRRRDRPDAQFIYDITVPPDEKPTQPYWLETPRDGFLYDWSTAGAARTQPFGAPLLVAEAMLSIGGENVTVRKEFEYRFVDPVRGEIRRRLDVVPRVSVEPVADLRIVATSETDKQFEVLLTVRNNARHATTGTARFAVPDGWAMEPASIDFSLPASPASATLTFDVTLPDTIIAGEYPLDASATIGEVNYQQKMHKIAYPHIQTHRTYEQSRTEFEVIDVKVAPVKIGYIMGSGDKVPEALRRLGLSVTLLDDVDLTTSDLSRFDTIVVGIRASQTRPAFVANNRRLLEFAVDGGTLIVQYQQPDFIAKDLAPFSASMEGNVRVVDEKAPVVILEPDHPVFNFPNRITTDDFNGWVQERNNYNFTSFDRNHYLPLTESHDEGEADSEGGMLYARIGDGIYIYTAYSWFRQLPNGVPGAYRLFANLLSQPAAAH